MISEEALRQAAAEASDCLVRSLDEAGIPVHNFSARFERKMRRLIRRTRHPAAYRALIRVACAFLAFLLGSGVFLAVNPEARAAFFGWVRTQYERLFVYDSTESSSGHAVQASDYINSPNYTLSWLPDGYAETERYVYADFSWVIYTNYNNDEITFLYSNTGNLHINYDSNIQSPAKVNNQCAEFYQSQNESGRNNLVWSNSDRSIIFSISGKFAKEDLIHMAEQCIEF